MVQQFELKLVDSYMLYDRCRHMVFERADGEPLAFIAGQFIQLHFEHEGRKLRRSYSIATVAEAPEQGVRRIEIAVSYVDGGAATARLSAMAPGDVIDASGPYGRFVLGDEAVNRTFLIATGTGVTPYRAMLPEIQRRLVAGDQEFYVLFGARYAHEVLYRDEFMVAHEELTGFAYHPCLSRSLPESEPDNTRQGYVQAALQSFAPNPETDIAYLCGNPDMVDDCFRMLKETGFPVPRIRREKYISPR